MATSRRRLCALLALPMLAAGAPAETTLDLKVEGLRNHRGTVMICATRRVDFLTCKDDPAHIVKSVSAASTASIRLAGLQPGEWSVLLVHDENGNGKLDKMMGIPREGFAFSRNPAMRMGPPRYADVHFALGAKGGAQVLKVKYLI